MRILRNLCGSWGLLPASYTLQGIATVDGAVPWARGGFSDVWRGTLGDEEVAVKVIMTADAKLKKVFAVAHPHPSRKAYLSSAII